MFYIGNIFNYIHVEYVQRIFNVGNFNLLFSIFDASLFLAVFCIVALTILLISKFRRTRKINVPNKIKYSKKQRNGSVVLKSAQYESDFEIPARLSKAMEDKLQKDWLEINFGTIEIEYEKFVKCGKTVQIPESRCPKLHCLKKSQAKNNLHINKLRDWFRNPVFVGCTPMPVEFPKFWDMVLGEKIGVIAWIGKNGSKNNDGKCKKMSSMPYISMEEGQFVSCESGGWTVDARTDLVVNVRNICKICYISVRLVKDNELVEGEVYVVVVSEWPTSVTWHINMNLVHLSRIVEELGREQKLVYDAKYGNPSSDGQTSSGVLFHCTNGVEFSSSMLALYIGRQIYFERKVINIVGLINVIKDHRYGAFLATKNAHKQVAVLASLMETIHYYQMNPISKVPILEFKNGRELWPDSNENNNRFLTAVRI